ARGAVGRGRALLAASLASLDRREAAVARTDARANRDQAEIKREIAATDREPAPASVLAAPPAPPTSQRLAALRHQLVTAAARLAEAEEKIARSMRNERPSSPPKRTNASKAPTPPARRRATPARSPSSSNSDTAHRGADPRSPSGPRTAGTMSCVPARALFHTAPRCVEIRELPTPRPAAGEVLVRTLCSGISGGTERLVY